MEANERKKLIDGLITNCSCQENNVWNEDDRELLENMSDEKLTSLAKQRQTVTTNTALVEAVSKTFGVKELTVNSEGRLLANGKAVKTKSLRAKMAEDDEDLEDHEAAADDTSVTNEERAEREWFAKAPRSVQEKHAYVANMIAKEKAGLIEKLVANKTGEAKTKAVEYLSGKSMDELKTLIDLLPATNAKAEDDDLPVLRKPAHYIGQAVGIVGNRQGADDENAGAPLHAPTINYKEESENRHKRTA